MTAPRNPALIAALDDIAAYAKQRMDSLQATTGFPNEILIIAACDGTAGADDDGAEVFGALIDPARLAAVMVNTVQDWVDQGILDPADLDDDGPLFTATFDPAKVRPS